MQTEKNQQEHFKQRPPVSSFVLIILLILHDFVINQNPKNK